jgi:hypothetical protein
LAASPTDVNTAATDATDSIVNVFIIFAFNLCRVETSAIQKSAIQSRGNEKLEEKQPIFIEFTLLN